VQELKDTCRWFFSVESNVRDVHTHFFEWVDQMGLKTNFAVRSPVDVVFENLKKFRPQEVYGSSVRQTTRLSIGAQSYLEPAITLSSDVLFFATSFRGRWILQEDLLSEIQRRNKHMCVGPLDDFARWKELRNHGFDCVLTNDPIPMAEP
jgi:hypothetical protein